MKPSMLKEIPLENLQKAGYNPRKNLHQNDPEYEALKKSIVELGILFKEIDYGMDLSGLTVSTLLTGADTAKDNPEGLSGADAGDVSKFFTVKRGCRGGAVRRLQTWLNDVQGGNLLAEDGDFGAATDVAVRVFQQAQGLTADGVVGAKTWAALAQARKIATEAQG